MKRKQWCGLVAALLIIVMVIGVVFPVVSGLSQDRSIDYNEHNIQALMGSGLFEPKAGMVADSLKEAGCGRIVSIQADDVGDGYDLLIYDDANRCYTAVMDYFGNLLKLDTE